MADENMRGIRVGIDCNKKGKAEEGDTGMRKVACPLYPSHNMMWTLFLIGALIISMFILLAAIPLFRIYYRTGMKASLLPGLGYVAVSIGLSGVALIASIRRELTLWDNASTLPLFLLIIAGVFLTLLGFVLENTKEGGLWKEICDRTTYWERFTGRVPILKDEKIPPPFFKRLPILILGSSIMTAGILTIIITVLSNKSLLREHLISYSIFAIMFGLLFIISSFVFLNKGKK
jgi:tellurite resistance protein TehA-like permease